jgi:hypothetical protein
MKQSSPASADNDWIETYLPTLDSADTERPAFRAVLSPTGQKAERTARIARELTEAETEARQATTARLRAARIGKAADVHADPAHNCAKP